MAKRRSLDDALTPEQEAFIQTGSTTLPKVRRGAPNTLNPKGDGKGIAAPAPGGSHQETAQPSNAKPDLVDLHTRIESWINSALLRASTERKIQRAAPYTQRDIVAEALANWLQSNGYVGRP